jgi:hypothetical protein
MAIFRSGMRRAILAGVVAAVVAAVASGIGDWIAAQAQRPQQIARDVEQNAYAELGAYSGARSVADLFPR